MAYLYEARPTISEVLMKTRYTDVCRLLDSSRQRLFEEGEVFVFVLSDEYLSW